MVYLLGSAGVDSWCSWVPVDEVGEVWTGADTGTGSGGVWERTDMMMLTG